MAFFYAIKWSGPDGEHLNGMMLTKRNDELANKRVARQFAKVKVISITPATPQEIHAMGKEIVAKNPSRIPIEEATGGQPILAIQNPDLLKPEHESV